MTGYPMHVYEMIVDDKKIGVIEQWIPDLPQSARGLCNRRIVHLHVDKEYQGRGYGRDLVEHFEKRSIEQGLNYITVNSSTSARGFYQHLGFIKTPTRWYGKAFRWITGINSEYYKPLNTQQTQKDFFELTNQVHPLI